MKEMRFILLGAVCFFVLACSQKTTTGDQASQDKALVESQQAQEEDVEQSVDPKQAGTPTDAIKNLDKKVEEYQLGQNLTAEQKDSNASLKKKIIRGTFDIKELCRLSLGKHWDTLAEAQRKKFVSLMTELLETKAIFSKEQLQGQNKLYRIRYEKEVYDDPEKKTATVSSKMDVPKEKMTLDITYKLLLTQYGWKIFDVIVDDASLLSNYKFQFDRIITEHGFDELITRMNEKLRKISAPKG